MQIRRNRLVAWIAGAAVLLQALWPLVSHARPTGAALLVPICSVDGIPHLIDLDSGKAPFDKRRALPGDHCKLCAFGSDRAAALPTEPAALLAVVDLPVERSNVLPVPLPEPLNHPPAQPRAPPLFL